ncbi:DegT/DnrJ/EryC1/StrS family aminotransferase [Microbacterium sp. SSW1-49]|uniref:DegT/DnrJ/EryC1/StrS family aminotransferase n=1 Tax=Microbacterium croceum TaxID=2851645 RepID=A0ABT0FDX3_9MICO|nr:DegT/DnrJ/EryC1/StrS family aminotransferase [Microbacterium croceum]MCK2035912.1 DegT/DnrJ/EryC1/StrS family aminotransferase [Microbacterium croceum]
MIPVSEPDLGPLEREYLLDAFDSGWISSRGHYVVRAEKQLEFLTGASYASVCSNGTTALHLALLAGGISRGDEVIIPSLTYVATINAVYYVDAVPVIVDVLDSTWCIDPAAVEAAITPRTTAILAVDLYGQTANYIALRQIADRHGLLLIADAAESLGASLNGTPAGALADISTFSFFGNKVVTSGEGGAVTTERADFHARIQQLRNQGNHATQRYFHEVVGFNYRMTNVAAAILTAQLERAEELIAHRRRVVDDYVRLLGPDTRLRAQQVSMGAVPTPWMFSVRIAGASSIERDGIIDALATQGIESRPVFPLIQDMPFVPVNQRTSTPVAEQISREGISLPTYPRLTSDDIATVCTAVRGALPPTSPVG